MENFPEAKKINILLSQNKQMKSINTVFGTKVNSTGASLTSLISILKFLLIVK